MTDANKERPIIFSGPIVRAILEEREVTGSNEQRKVRLDQCLVREAYENGYTIKEIADACGCSVQPIKRIMSEAAIVRRPAKQRAGVMAGDKNPAWSGGRRTRPDGYIEVWTNDGPVLEHRLVMEQHLGRSLEPSEVVHHIDKDRANNVVDNLELTTHAEHIRHHIDDMHAARWGK